MIELMDVARRPWPLEELAGKLNGGDGDLKELAGERLGLAGDLDDGLIEMGLEAYREDVDEAPHGLAGPGRNTVRG